MKKKAKVRNGLRLYPSAKGGRQKRNSQNLLLMMTHILAVWFVIVSYWEAAFSVFPAPTGPWALWTSLFCFSAFSVAVLHSRGKWLWLLAGIGTAAAFLWRYKALAAAVLNYLANSYLLKIHDCTLPGRGAAELYEAVQATENASVSFYQITPLSEWKIAAFLGLISVPILLPLGAALCRQRGKFLSLLFPLALIGFLGSCYYMPSRVSGWALVLSTAVYCVAYDCRLGTTAFQRGAATASILMLLAVVSMAFAIPLEVQKTKEDGFYLKTRSFIQDDMIAKMQETWNNALKKQKTASSSQKPVTPHPPAEELPDESHNEPYEKLPENEDSSNNLQGFPSPIQETNISNFFSETIPSWDDASDPSLMRQNLNALSYYRPDSGSRMWLTVARQPRKTVYYPMAYGGTYQNGYLEDTIVRTQKTPDNEVWDEAPLSDEVLNEYSRFPKNLTKLWALCFPMRGKSLENVSDFIQKQFKENTVYDYHPGRTPVKWDFSEYFLFENKKGFCVHFATTAMLMYRMCGYPARYVRGFAIPAKAFSRQENGTYRAEIDGTMGHAWCEVYDGTWIRKEHTLPYTGSDPEPVLPAADSETEARASAAAQRIFLGIFSAVLLFTTIFILRILLIKKQREWSFHRLSSGAGILNVYNSIYKIALFPGRKKKEPVKREEYEIIRSHCPESCLEDLEWLHNKVLEILFYKNRTEKPELGRAILLYRRFSKETAENINGWKRFQYKYIRCL